MKEWIIENIFKSKTAWAAGIALIIGIVTWIAAVPKDLAGWVALGAFVITALGGWVAANKVQSSIDQNVGK